MTKNNICVACEPYEEEYVNCECHSPEHTFKISFDKEEGELYLQVFLTTWEPWYKRIWPAVKYIFGYKCKYGHFDECIIDKHKSAQLFEIVKKFKEYHD